MLTLCSSLSLCFHLMQYNINDIIQDRPALSRWHPDYASEFGE